LREQLTQRRALPACAPAAGLRARRGFSFVIPAQAGIQTAHPPSGFNHGPLDSLSFPRSSRLRGNDGELRGNDESLGGASMSGVLQGMRRRAKNFSPLHGTICFAPKSSKK